MVNKADWLYDFYELLFYYKLGYIAKAIDKVELKLYISLN